MWPQKEMAHSKRNVVFCAVACLSNRVIVSSYTHDNSKEAAVSFKGTCQKLITNDKLINQSSAVVINAADNCNCHILTDESFIYVLFVECHYPQRTAFEMLVKMRSKLQKENIERNDAENSLNKRIKPWLQKLCAEYDDPADKLRICQDKVHEVTEIMHENIKKIMKGSEKLEELETDAEHLKATAGAFVRNTKELSCKLWWQNARLKVAVAAVSTAVVGLGVGCAVLPS